MKKIIAIIGFLIVLSCFCYAGEMTTNQTALGNEVQPNASVSYFGALLTSVNWMLYNNPLTQPLGMLGALSTRVLLPDIYLNKKTDAESGLSPKSNEEVQYEADKKIALDIANQAWSLVIAMVRVMYETVVLIVLVFEMRLILFIFVEFIPDMIFKIRDFAIDAIYKRSRA